MSTYSAQNYAEAVNQLRQLDPDELVRFEGQPDEMTVAQAIAWAEQQQQQQGAPGDRVALLERRLAALEWEFSELQHQVKRDQRRDRTSAEELRAAVEQMRGDAS